MNINEDLDPQEVNSIRAGVAQVEGNSVDFNPFSSVWDYLNKIWKTKRTLKMRRRVLAREDHPAVTSSQSSPTEVSRVFATYPHVPTEVSSEWYIGMSNEFLKAIQNVDRKLQGRILLAITHISREPTTLHGDTVKPFTSEMKGLWRYRVGDFRLVYIPEIKDRRVTLLSFASRGDVYE